MAESRTGARYMEFLVMPESKVLPKPPQLWEHVKETQETN